jgi:hypothetical protein
MPFSTSKMVEATKRVVRGSPAHVSCSQHRAWRGRPMTRALREHTRGDRTCATAPLSRCCQYPQQPLPRVSCSGRRMLVGAAEPRSTSAGSLRGRIEDAHKPGTCLRTQPIKPNHMAHGCTDTAFVLSPPLTVCTAQQPRHTPANASIPSKLILPGSSLSSNRENSASKLRLAAAAALADGAAEPPPDPRGAP